MRRFFVCTIFILLVPIICRCEDIVISVVYNNVVHDDRLQSAWGMACIVQGLEKTILFDTGGDGAILLSNMEKCNISPNLIDIVVLSHIHADHVGGLWDFLAKNSKVTVYVPRSFPHDFKRGIEQLNAKVVAVSSPLKICRRVWSTGQMGTAISEQSLIIDTPQGLVVISGCAHPGIVNIARRTRQIVKKPIFLICGGFHLGGHSKSQVDDIIQAFKKMGVATIGPSHCTGTPAIEQFRHAWGDKFTEFGCGAKVHIRQ